MKVKKAFQVIVEVVATEDGNCNYVCRTMQGQPIEVCSTPVELTSLLSELSADENLTGQPAEIMAD